MPYLLSPILEEALELTGWSEVRQRWVRDEHKSFDF